jgi:hypothetical protein
MGSYIKKILKKRWVRFAETYRGPFLSRETVMTAATRRVGTAGPAVRVGPPTAIASFVATDHTPHHTIIGIRCTEESGAFLSAIEGLYGNEASPRFAA